MVVKPVTERFNYYFNKLLTSTKTSFRWRSVFTHYREKWLFSSLQLYQSYSYLCLSLICFKNKNNDIQFYFLNFCRAKYDAETFRHLYFHAVYRYVETEIVYVLQKGRGHLKDKEVTWCNFFEKHFCPMKTSESSQNQETISSCCSWSCRFWALQVLDSAGSGTKETFYWTSQGHSLFLSW